MKTVTIWAKLTEKLGRPPTNAECREACLAILREARAERKR
jgi:hypothetical protein